MSGISNFTIKKIINEIDGDLKPNFVGVFLSNETFRFFKFKHLIREKKTPYPFMIVNTGRSNEEREHWWSLMEISSKDQIFLFDSFGFVGLKEFIVDNDRQIIDNFFYGLEEINKKDKVINVTYVHFDSYSYKKVNKASLTPIAKDFFHSLSKFSKVHNQKSVDVFMVDDQLQNIKSDTCGLFQLYFYMNLFLPKQSSKIVNNRTFCSRTKHKKRMRTCKYVTSADVLNTYMKYISLCKKRKIS